MTSRDPADAWKEPWQNWPYYLNSQPEVLEALLNHYPWIVYVGYVFWRKLLIPRFSADDGPYYRHGERLPCLECGRLGAPSKWGSGWVPSDFLKSKTPLIVKSWDTLSVQNGGLWSQQQGAEFLHGLFEQDHVDVIRILVDHLGLRVHEKFNDEEIFIQAAERAPSPKIPRLLLQRGFDITVSDSDGWTPLHLVWDLAVAKLLLESGADIEAKTNGGSTPLHLASCFDIALMKLLLDHGANVNARCDSFGQTPLHNAVDHGMGQYLEFPTPSDLARVALLATTPKVDLNVKDNQGRSVLYEAAGGDSRSVETVKIQPRLVGLVDLDAQL